MRKNEISCDCEMIHDEVVNAVRAHMLSDEVFLKASSFLKALSDLTRIKIIYALSKNKMCVCDIANLLNLSKSAISHQLATLRENNLVKSQKIGKVVYYELFDRHVKQMLSQSIKHTKD